VAKKRHTETHHVICHELTKDDTETHYVISHELRERMSHTQGIQCACMPEA